MDEGEQLFLEGRLSETRVLADRRNRLIHFLLEEVERDVFLGLKIVEDGAFRDSSLAGNRLGGRCLEPFRLEEIQRGGHNALPDRLLALSAPSHGTLRPGAAVQFSSG